MQCWRDSGLLCYLSFLPLLEMRSNKRGENVVRTVLEIKLCGAAFVSWREVGEGCVSRQGAVGEAVVSVPVTCNLGSLSEALGLETSLDWLEYRVRLLPRPCSLGVGAFSVLEVSPPVVFLVVEMYTGKDMFSLFIGERWLYYDYNSEGWENHSSLVPSEVLLE